MYRVWEYGGRASKGLAQVAKWGSPRVLESELKAESQHIRTIIKARGLWYPNVNGKTFAVFRTDKKNHLVSLVIIIKLAKTKTITGLRLFFLRSIAQFFTQIYMNCFVSS